MTDALDLSKLTPEQADAIRTAVNQAETANAAAAPPEPAPVPEAAPAEAAPAETPQPTEAPAEPVPAPGTPEEDAANESVGSLLDRLRLQRTANSVKAVLDWLEEHGLKV